MAHSRRKESQRPLAEELAEELRAAAKRVEIASDDEALRDRCIAIPEALDLGHARLRNECWGPLGQRTRRSRRLRHRRTILHATRPSEAAEARFAPSQSEFLD